MAESFAEYPPRTALPNLTLHESTSRDAVNPAEVAKNWLTSLLTAISQKDTAAFSVLFFEDSFWRDIVALHWGFASNKGPEAIAKHVLGSTAGFGQAIAIADPPLCPQLADMGPMTFLQFGFTFTTKHGAGRGIVRLGNDGPDSWKAWTVSTVLEELHGQEEFKKTAAAKTNGANGTGGETEDLQVLIIGSGQSGVQLAAWLKELGINYLIVDKNARPGDAWRARYDCVKSHTPSYCDHFTKLKYPEGWEKFPDRDPIAEWVETYSNTLGLNVASNTAVTSVDRNAETGKYSVTVDSNGTKRVYKANHVVLATGIFAPTPALPDIGGRDSFKGQAYHTSEHKSASKIPDVHNKKVVVIGAASSGHDVAQDFVNAGAKSVAIVQRSRLAVVSTDSVEKFQTVLWNTPGLGVEDADLLATSMPREISLTLGVGMWQMMMQNDKELLEGLEKAGMALVDGADGVGLLDLQLIKFGHFYIDQGASPMIIDGRIKIHRCAEGVKEFYKDGITLADGTKVEADLVVFATGFQPFPTSLKPLFGSEVAEKAKEWMQMTEKTGSPGPWRPSGFAGLWYMTGSFILCRQFAKTLALQISAVERGIDDQHYSSQ